MPTAQTMYNLEELVRQHKLEIKQIIINSGEIGHIKKLELDRVVKTPKQISALLLIPEEEVLKNIAKIYEIVFGKKLEPPKNKKKEKTKHKEREERISLNTLANSLYFYLYELYGREAVEIMYNTLEPFLTKNFDYRVRVIFLPVDARVFKQHEDIIRSILGYAKEHVCRDPPLLVSLVCKAQNSFFPEQRQRECIEFMEEVLSSVCR